MNDFDSKWQRCAARAREAAPRESQAPPGFSTRVVANGLETPAAPLASDWERMALGWLAGVLTLLTFCILLELPHFRDSRPLEPGVENAVAQLVWSL